jgi:hypothetical protein
MYTRLVRYSIYEPLLQLQLEAFSYLNQGSSALQAYDITKNQASANQDGKGLVNRRIWVHR